MLFRFGLNTPIAEALNPVVLGIYLGCALLMVLVAIAFSLDEVIGLKDASFGALVTAFPNTGFMGVPLLAALFGPAIVGPMIATILIDMFVTSSLCLALAQAGGAAGGVRAGALRSLRGALANPMPWAIALGGTLGALGWRPVGPVDAVVKMLADAASPVALFTIGAVLARSQMASASHGGSTTPALEYLPVVAEKLLLHPLLVMLAGNAAIRLGMPLDPFALMVMVLVAALPSASNVVILAEKFAADSGRIARIILVSTALAFVTFSGAVTLLT
jgi:predicted permease